MKFRVLVVGAAVLVLGLGITQVRNASVDVLPEFAPPQVEIQAEALGLSAAEVEQLITVPLEQDLLNGIPWLDQIRSESVPGLSSIDLIFQPRYETSSPRGSSSRNISPRPTRCPRWAPRRSWSSRCPRSAGS